MDKIKWGVASTILAPTRDILAFAAYHLAAGAHRLYIYLDAPNPEAYALLDAHSKVRVITCDAAYWRQRKRVRPETHQVRQTANATHAYNRRPEVDWLIHMDRWNSFQGQRRSTRRLSRTALIARASYRISIRHTGSI